MPDFLRRLIEEEGRLNAKIVALKDFIGTPEYEELGDIQRTLLPIQLKAMETDYGCLRLRIDDLK